MNWDGIWKRALRQTHTEEADYTSTEASEDMEFRNQELVDEIVSITKWDYFWDTGISDSVVNQSEYLAEKLGIDPDDLDIKKINKVFVKYSEEQEFPTFAKYQNPGALEYHPDYYKTNQPKSDPFFYIQDNSIFVYPAPTEVITGAIEIFVIHKPKAISTDSAETDIEIPLQFHKLLSDWLKIDIYLTQGKTNEAQIAQNVYDKGILKMVKFLKERYNQPIKRTFKQNLNSYR